MINFSVSMCVYKNDNPEWFETAVESIINQTVKPNEIVIVVDGPIPNEIEVIINKYEENHLFRIIRLKENQGHGNARRIGLENCSNDLVALMDADDISLPIRFEKQLAFFENDADLSIVGGQISEFYDDPQKPFSYRIVPEKDNEIKVFMKRRCPINQPSVMFKKADVQKAGGYIDWYCNEDYYLWIRMSLANMKMANTPDILVNMRVAADSYKRRGGIKYFKSEKKLQKYMLSQGLISYWVYFINVCKRFIVQILLPNGIRSLVFRRFARSKKR